MKNFNSYASDARNLHAPHSLRKQPSLWKAITVLCGCLSLFYVVSSLCVVVTSLRFVVSSLCLVVTSLRFVVSSLCLVVTSLRFVVSSLCLVMQS